MATNPLERQRAVLEERERRISKAHELRAKGMSQSAIADELGVSQAWVWKWLRVAPPKESRKAS